MGAYSTVQITRDVAYSYISAKVKHLNDDELKRVMDALLDPYLYNTIITYDSWNDNSIIEDLTLDLE